MGIEGIRGESSSQIDSNDVEAAPTPSAPAPQPEDAAVAYEAPHGETDAPVCEEMSDADTMTPAQLQAFASAHNEASADLDGAVREQINKLMDNAPDGKPTKAMLTQFVSKLMDSKDAQAALGKLSDPEVRILVHSEMKNAGFEPKVAERFMGELHEVAKTRSADSLCKVAHEAMESAAAKLEKNPELARQLAKEYGATPKELIGHLRSQAEELARPGYSRLFRTAAEHDVDGKLMKQAGIEPNSFAAQSLASARSEGVADENFRKNVQTATKVALLFTGAGALADLALSAPELLEKHKAVGDAMAKEIAGTKAHGEVAKAKVSLYIGVAVAGLEAVGGKALEHVAEHAAEHVALKGEEAAAEALTRPMVAKLAEQSATKLSASTVARMAKQAALADAEVAMKQFGKAEASKLGEYAFGIGANFVERGADEVNDHVNEEGR